MWTAPTVSFSISLWETRSERQDIHKTQRSAGSDANDKSIGQKADT